jgi:DNA uptake protein ComE-like DNA-binding protein
VQKSASELDNKIDDLKVKVQTASPKAKTDFNVAMQDVNTKRAALDSDMRALGDQSAQALDSYRAKVDKDIDDLKKSIDVAKGKL